MLEDITRKHTISALRQPHKGIENISANLSQNVLADFTCLQIVSFCMLNRVETIKHVSDKLAAAWFRLE